MAETPILALFDIDGTILSPGSGARKSLSQAIAEFFDEPVEIKAGDCAGKTDPLIIANLLEKAGCLHEEFPMLLPVIKAVYRAAAREL